MKTIIRAAVLAGLFAVSVNAEWVGQDGSTVVTNPNDSTALTPEVNYDQTTGMVWINTLGMNGTSDTADGSMIGGDDVGMISFQIESVEMQSEFLLTGFIDGVVWGGQYFNGKVQMFGTAAGNEYLLPSERTDLFQLPVGLDASNFGSAEIAVNFASGEVGDILNNAGTNPNCMPINIVPEPASLVLALTSLMGFFGLARRSK